MTGRSTPGSSLDLATEHCLGPQATVAWCDAMDVLVAQLGSDLEQGVDGVGEAIRLHYLTGRWDFATADHAINMLAGYGQRQGVLPQRFWQTYLDFDSAEIGSFDSSRVRASLSRPGDLVVRDPAGWRESDFDAWGAGDGVGQVADPPIPTADLGLVDVRWPTGRAFECAVAMRWLGGVEDPEK